MTTMERKKLLVEAIEKFEHNLVALSYFECESSASFTEREEQKEALRHHLRCAHSVLVALNKEELEAA